MKCKQIWAKYVVESENNMFLPASSSSPALTKMLPACNWPGGLLQLDELQKCVGIFLKNEKHACMRWRSGMFEPAQKNNVRLNHKCILKKFYPFTAFYHNSKSLSHFSPSTLSVTFCTPFPFVAQLLALDGCHCVFRHALITWKLIILLISQILHHNHNTHQTISPYN